MESRTTAEVKKAPASTAIAFAAPDHLNEESGECRAGNLSRRLANFKLRISFNEVSSIYQGWQI